MMKSAAGNLWSNEFKIHGEMGEKTFIKIIGYVIM